jgi:hypothetical protein
MRSYVITTGVLFALLVVAHIWRIFGENPRLASDPWYLAITAACAALAVWAWVVLRRSGHGTDVGKSRGHY